MGPGEMRHQRKLHLLNWDMICKPIEMWGIGLRKASLLNKALLAN